jgi:fermentation-respiration switch protein FrsA (DUF1100 family)
MRTDVEFPGFGGVTLRGWLYRPAASAAPTPAVVMAHGFSATRHMGLPAFAEDFAAAGYAVLVYDHRNLGDSDGEPRQEINPWAQARDYRYALTWIADQPGIDPDRLAIWGSSFSGGEVIVVGAVDRRVRAVIANVPFAGMGQELSASARAERFETMRAALEDESGAGPADTTAPPVGPLPVIRPSNGDPEAAAFLPQPESTAWFEAVGGSGTGWQNTSTLHGLSGDFMFDPSYAAPFLAPTPLLMVVATEDRVASAQVARSAYALAQEPKRLELIPGDHFVPCSGEPQAQVSKAMLDFLREFL